MFKILLGLYFNLTILTLNDLVIIKAMRLLALISASILFLSSCVNQKFEIEPKIIDQRNSVQIGLLVPLDSKDMNVRHLAKSLRDAVFLAKSDLRSSNLEIQVYPTSGLPESALAASIEAINNGAQIIVGPFFAEETIAISGVTHTANLKVLSFSNDSRVAGENVFILGTTSSTISDRIVKFAVQQGYLRFGVINPSKKEALVSLQSVSRSVHQNGGAIKLSVTYPRSLDDTAQIAPRIKEDSDSKNIEAIIFTETPNKKIALIAAEFENTTMGNQIQKPKFMGLSRWDITNITLSSPALQGGWFAVPDRRFKRKFEAKFQKKYNYQPHLLAGLGYNAIATLGALLQQTKLEGKLDPFSKIRLLNPDGFVGVNGIFRFRTNHTTEKAMAIAEVYNGSYKIVDPAPFSFYKNVEP